jgi:hypothetical protein
MNPNSGIEPQSSEAQMAEQEVLMPRQITQRAQMMKRFFNTSLA